MATLDLSGVLQAMVNSTTPDALMQHNMGLAMFSNKVSDVAAKARVAFREEVDACNALVAKNVMTPEQAQLCIASAAAQMASTQQFSANYFG